MNQKRVNKSYSQAFKEEAVALVTQQGYSVPEAAKSLGSRALLKKLREELSGLSIAAQCC